MVAIMPDMELLSIKFTRNDAEGGMRFRRDSNAHALTANERTVISNMLRQWADEFDHDIFPFQGVRTHIKPPAPVGLVSNAP
jgi:hypothetical protein